MGKKTALIVKSKKWAEKNTLVVIPLIYYKTHSFILGEVIIKKSGKSIY